MIYGYQGPERGKRRRMAALMVKSVGVSLAVVGIGGVLIDGNNMAGYVLAVVGFALSILGRE